MELKYKLCCIWLFTAFFIAVVSAADTSKLNHDDIIEQLMLRVDRLEARAEDQQSEINHLRAQLVSQKKRTHWLESFVRRLKKKERPAEHVYGSPTIVRKNSEDGQPASTSNIRSAHERIRQTEIDMPVAFFATLTTPLSHVGIDQVIVFDQVVTNVGNAYHSHIGSFIAPVSGTYAVFVTMTTYNTHASHYYIAVNGKSVARFFIGGQDSPWSQTSQSAIVQVMAGDDITIRNNEADKSINGGEYTTFGGFLIYSDSSDAGTIVGK